MPDLAGKSGAVRLWAVRDSLLFGLTVVLLLGGVVAVVLGAHDLATGLWIAATLVGLAYSSVTIAVSLRRRQPSVDVIAWLALIGALLVGEPVAGA
ncbi:MAG: hypothetical protein HOV71_05005, partial [Hamadaea sp.]|nr:hypothetical protein [Hamadaea sp.]